jgi:transcriptional regulator with XRE-family HTH domain
MEKKMKKNKNLNTAKNLGCGERIKLWREKKNMTQQNLADISCLKQVNICRYETGSRNPSIKAAKKLANVLEVSAAYILGLTDIPYGND